MILVPLGKVRLRDLVHVRRGVLMRSGVFLCVQTGGSGYIGLLWGIILGDFLTKTIKGKDLMIGMARGARGL